MDGKPKLLVQVREPIRLKHYSIRTEQVYYEWVKRKWPGATEHNGRLSRHRFGVNQP